MKKVAVLGSGTVGEVLANGFLKHGYSVMRGSRDPKKLEGWKETTKGEAAIGQWYRCFRLEALRWPRTQQASIPLCSCYLGGDAR